VLDCLAGTLRRANALLTHCTLGLRLILRGINDCFVSAHDSAGRQHRLIDMRGSENMHDVFAVGEEIVCDNATMATPPDGFGAHDRAAALVAENAEPLNACGERRRQRIVCIITKTTNPPIRVRRRLCDTLLATETAKLGDVRIVYLTALQFAWKSFEIELRISARPWHRSYIYDKFDVRFPKEINELFEGPGRMTYSEEDARNISSIIETIRSGASRKILNECPQNRKRDRRLMEQHFCTAVE
jgi:hypothetical protein